MANRRSAFRQSDVEKVLKAYRSAGFSAPVIIIEPERITAKPVEAAADTAPNEWDEVLR
ncbi:hypothetical protein ATH84_100763 [Paracoccus versutus]|uniref:Uncharacterized protein n=1 Tax=Paracoccus versutus TaxID=34007 RepID=A0AAQ0HJT2_PARVE|nr:hypothetical protein [Paracoccus versutus]REG53166.1 hypothetical protein ATH84_100763 [Paracoccus versutus]